MYKMVFYSPGPYCNTDTYEVFDFGEKPSDAEMADVGYSMAVDHYESYGDAEDDEFEPEYDYCWYEMDDPQVEGRI